jgi:hypothetical protein
MRGSEVGGWIGRRGERIGLVTRKAAEKSSARRRGFEDKSVSVANSARAELDAQRAASG